MTDFVEVQAAAWTDIWHRFGYSGPGSTIEVTTPARAWLERILTDYDITTMLDAPCGDFQWMQHVNLGGVDYTGWDVQPDIVDRNRLQHPRYTFKQMNLLTVRRIPKVDLIWCRDFVMHLPVDAAVRVVNKLANAATFLAVTNHPGVDNTIELPPEGHDGRPGYWCRGLDLEAPPFNLTKRIDAVVEAQDGTTGKIGQEMVLFDLR